MFSSPTANLIVGAITTFICPLKNSSISNSVNVLVPVNVPLPHSPSGFVFTKAVPLFTLKQPTANCWIASPHNNVPKLNFSVFVLLLTCVFKDNPKDDVCVVFNVCNNPLNGDVVISWISAWLVPASKPAGVEKDVVVTPDGFSNVFDHLTVPDFVCGPPPETSDVVGK